MMGSLSVEASAEAKNGNGAGYHYAHGALREPRPIRVVMIGAGVSGIGAVKLFKERFANQPVTLKIYEKAWERFQKITVTLGSRG